MRETIAATYKCKLEDVVIVSIRKGSTIVDFVIKKFMEVVNQVLKTNFDTNPEKLIKDLDEKAREMLIREYKIVKEVSVMIEKK